jgi:hypothetical protein
MIQHLQILLTNASKELMDLKLLTDLMASYAESHSF